MTNNYQVFHSSYWTSLINLCDSNSSIEILCPSWKLIVAKEIARTILKVSYSYSLCFLDLVIFFIWIYSKYNCMKSICKWTNRSNHSTHRDWLCLGGKNREKKIARESVQTWVFFKDKKRCISYLNSFQCMTEKRKTNSFICKLAHNIKRTILPVIC